MSKITPRKLSLLALILIVPGVIWIKQSSGNANQVESQNTVVKTFTTKESDNVYPVEFSGFIKGNDRADIAPAASGRILRIIKLEGEFAKQGETLAIIEASQLDAQISAAASGVLAMKKTVDDAENYYNQLVDQAEQGRDAAKNSGDKNSIDAANEAVKTAKQARYLQIQSIKDQLIEAEGNLKIAQSGKGNFAVTAPFSGTITTVYGREGGFANFSMPLLSIASVNNLEIETYVPASLGYKIKLGDRTVVYSENNAPIPGIVTTISPADAQTQKDLIRVQLDDKTGLIRFGDFVRGKIYVPQESNQLLVPKQAIISRGGDSIVFVVDDQNIVHEQRVETGYENNDLIAITAGLASGQKIVTEGQHYLVNGLTVNINETE